MSSAGDRAPAPAFRGRALEEHAVYLASVCSLSLAPVLLWQGRHVRRVTPRLPEAGGPREGRLDGVLPPLHLLVIGESTAAGVGVRTHDEGLAGHVSRTIGKATGRALVWMVRGRNGATAESTRTELLPQAVDFVPDLAVVVLGVNDTMRFSRPRRFVAALDALFDALRARRQSVGIVVAAVPPMGRFPALPTPLRAVLGLRARALDLAAARRTVGCDRTLYVSMPDAGHHGPSELFCEDGFHPSSVGYREWGRRLGEACLSLIEPSTGTRSP